MKLKGLTAGCVLATAGMAASAADMIDGAKPFICAATTATLCEPHADCTQGPAESVNIPLFLRVDLKAQAVESIREDGARRVSKVTSTEESDGHMILHGSEQGLAWSASISKKTGKMIVTGGRDNGFIVFGACTVL